MRMLPINQRQVFGRLQKCGIVHYGHAQNARQAAMIRTDHKHWAAKHPKHRVVLRSRNYGEYPVTVIDCVWVNATAWETASYRRKTAAASKLVAQKAQLNTLRAGKRFAALEKAAKALGYGLVKLHVDLQVAA